jgi:heme exporter protein C
MARSAVAARGTSSPLTRVLGGLALVGLVTTFALGLSLPRTVEQHEYSRLIAIHPALAEVAYLALGVVSFASLLYLVRRTRSRLWDLLAGASAEIAAVFLALTLVTGSIWGRPTWGVWWAWDARLTLTAILLAVDLGYLALRRVPAEIEARSVRSAVLGVILPALIIVDHFAVDWWRSLHQDSSLEDAKDNLGTPFLVAMFVGFLAFTLLYGWLLVHRFRLEQLEERLDDEGLAVALAERQAEATTDRPRPPARPELAEGARIQ